MSDLRRDENHAARGNFAIFRTGLEAGASADHVVDLVFAMRLLTVCPSGGQDLETGAHRRHTQELTVVLAARGALLVDLREAGEHCLHGVFTRRSLRK